MSQTNNTYELAEQVRAAAEAGDLAEVNRISAEIERQQGPRNFAEAWNYENKPAQPVPGGFESTWNFTKGGADA